ncbi:MAG: prephenate dehydratase [Acidimicrobiales bacterium]
MMDKNGQGIPSGPVILFQGPRGTSDERAAQLLLTVTAPDVHPAPSIETILHTVDLTPECLGLLPVENPLEGELAPVLDRIAFETQHVYIRETVVLVEQLEAFSLTRNARPRVAVSHPFVLALCGRYISRAGLASMTAPSTTEACKMVMTGNDDGMLALAPSEVGSSIGLHAYPDMGVDLPEVRTRYALIGREVAPVTGDDQTLLVVTPVADRPGSLATMLDKLSTRSIDLTSLRSRPIIVNGEGIHCFFLELRGHISEPVIQNAMVDIMKDGAKIRVLGSYPQWSGTPVVSPFNDLPLSSIGTSCEEPAPQDALLPPVANEQDNP